MSLPGPQSDQTQLDDSSHLRLTLPAPASELSFGEIFVYVYKHLESLTKRGHSAEAERMDTSSNVAVLLKLTARGSRSWTPLNTVWSAKAFRTVLYHAIAPDAGGPLWLRQAVTASLAEAMCYTRMSHVWETTFKEAKDFTNVFVDPGDFHYTQIIQQISQSDIANVRDLWIQEMPWTAVYYLADRFFPKVPLRENAFSFYSSITTWTYHYRVEIFRSLRPFDYINVFARLAKYGLNGTPLPPLTDAAEISTRIYQAGFLTALTLPHVMFWYGSHNLLGRMSNDPSCQWHDLLAAGPFALRSFSPGGSLVHGDLEADEAAGQFVHALFDQMRSGVGLKDFWRYFPQPAEQIIQKSQSINTIFNTRFYQDRFRQTRWRNVLTLAENYIGSLQTLRAGGHLPPTAPNWIQGK